MADRPFEKTEISRILSMEQMASILTRHELDAYLAEHPELEARPGALITDISYEMQPRLFKDGRCLLTFTVPMRKKLA